MKLFVLFLLAVVTLLVAGASVASANAGPPRPRPIEPSKGIAAVAGGAGAVLAGLWLIRRPKP
jgi:hypothetical protein